MLDKKFCLLATAAVAFGSVAHAQRDNISIVGSSTVYPFSTVVAEQFGKTTQYPTPTIESTGSGGGLKLFCAGVGVQHPDMTNASRAIKSSEVEDCIANGVAEPVEVMIGYDGIVLANSNEATTYELSRSELFLALARQVPNPDGDGVVDNPYDTWSQINPDLPEVKIEVLGPPPTSGTRDAFVELVMEEGCEAFEAINALDEDTRDAVCATMREDGAFVEAGENDNLIVQKLDANPQALGIFGFSFLEENLDKIHATIIDGVEPTFETIANGTYPVSRPLFVYVKKEHLDVIPGMRDFVLEFLSDRASGQVGYLTDRGLIPLSEEEHQAQVERVSSALGLN